MTVRSYTYDPECERLARYFLPKPATERLVKELSQAIQDTVEGWIKDERRRIKRDVEDEAARLRQAEANSRLTP